MNSNKGWILLLVSGGAVIGVTAGLLTSILRTAQQIDHHASDVWITGKNIAGNTVSIWMLGRTNETARKILDTTRSINSSINTLADRLA